MIFLGPNENAEFVSKIHVASNASHTALPKGSKLRNDVAFKTQISAQILNDFPLLHLLHFPTFYAHLFPALTALSEGRAGSAWELSEQ